VRRAVVLAFVLSVGPPARADEQPIKIDLEPKADKPTAAATQRATEPPEAPPPAPRRKGFVVDATLGALGFLGTFRRLAPPGPWLHLDFGFEPFRWLMVLAEAELAFTDTSVSLDASKVRAFPIYGFGFGVRPKVHVSDRVAIFLQGQLGGMAADVPDNALGILGYQRAESVRPYAGGRLGLEWYQIDRHLALGLMGGLRTCSGFSSSVPGRGDTPLLVDGGATLRYTF
jgi:hypothetical protein